jgi:hypothetical protein
MSAALNRAVLTISVDLECDVADTRLARQRPSEAMADHPQNHDTSERTICDRLPTITFSTLAMIFFAVGATSAMAVGLVFVPRSVPRGASLC